jgi:outer membrane protein TolC
MKTWLMTFAAAALLQGAGRPPLPAKLGLREAIEIAFANNRSLVRAAAQLRQAEGQAGQARSALLPQLSVALTETLQTVNLKALGIDIPFAPSRVGPFQSVDARASMTQNVLNTQVRRRDRAAGEQVQSLAALGENARELLAWQVALEFAQALRAQSAVSTLAEQTELSRKLLEIAEQRFEAGVASRLDVTRSRQQVRNLEQNLLEARNALVAAKLHLANLLHAEITDAFELEGAGETPATPPARDQALDAALRSRPDYRAAQAQVRAAEHRLASVQAQRFPVVQFRADYGQSGRKPFENLNTFRVQGVLSVPIYTGGRIGAEQAEAEGRLAELRAQADELRSQVETDVLSALAAAEAARREIEVATQAVELARDEVDLASERFSGGVADNTELVNAQDRLSRAEDNRVRATYRWRVARAQLARATGTAESSYRK